MATEKYKVLEDLNIDGAFHSAGDEVMLLDEVAETLVGKVSKVGAQVEAPKSEEKAEAPKEEEKAADESDKDEDSEEK